MYSDSLLWKRLIPNQISDLFFKRDPIEPIHIHVFEYLFIFISLIYYINLLFYLYLICFSTIY